MGKAKPGAQQKPGQCEPGLFVLHRKLPAHGLFVQGRPKVAQERRVPLLCRGRPIIVSRVFRMALAVSRSPFGVIFHAFGQSWAYVEVANLRGPDSSYLRIFCQNGSSEPLFCLYHRPP